MSDSAFFDTNVLVYAHVLNEPRKQKVAEQLYRRHAAGKNISLSTQVLQEFFVTLTKKVAGVSLEEALALTEDLAKLHVVTIQPVDILEAIGVQKRYRISFWDGLILTSAIKAQAGVLYTEDLSHGQIFGGLRVENPFLLH
ncbi:MAG: PIN domain-containing protein [Bryobacteraceae bacterium]